MNVVIFCLFTISIMLILGMFYFLFASKRSGVYPPKQLLKQRAGTLGTGGILFFLLGLLFFYIDNWRF